MNTLRDTIPAPVNALPVVGGHNPTVPADAEDWLAPQAACVCLEGLLWSEKLFAEAEPASRDGQRFLVGLILTNEVAPESGPSR